MKQTASMKYEHILF